MVGDIIAMDEKKAIRALSENKWIRRGGTLVTQDSLTPGAVAQVVQPLAESTRRLMNLRVEPLAAASGEMQPARLVLNASAAENLFRRHGYAISVTDDPQVGR